MRKCIYVILVMVSIVMGLGFTQVVFHPDKKPMEVVEYAYKDQFTSISSIKEKNIVSLDNYIEGLWEAHLGNRVYKTNAIHYGNDVYDCTDFTNDFLKVLDNQTLNVSYTAVYGKTYWDNCIDESNDFCFHCYLVINNKTFEPTTGRFVYNNSLYEVIRITDYCRA